MVNHIYGMLEKDYFGLRWKWYLILLSVVNLGSLRVWFSIVYDVT